jgi:hypothetical protein
VTVAVLAVTMLLSLRIAPRGTGGSAYPFGAKKKGASRADAAGRG